MQPLIAIEGYLKYMAYMAKSRLDLKQSKSPLCISHPIDMNFRAMR